MLDKLSNNKLPDNKLPVNKLPDNKSSNQGIFSNYLAEQINVAIENRIDFNPKDVLSIIEKTKNISNQTQPISPTQSSPDAILPSISQSETKSNYITNFDPNKLLISNQPNNNMITDKQNFLNNQYSPDTKVPKYQNPNNNTSKSQKCNGAKCTYKCDSSYSNAISYLEKEFKPLESFGNILDNYARF